MHRLIVVGCFVLGVPLLATSARSQGLPAAPPESVGLSAAGLKRLDSAMAAYVESGKLPGIVVAVARNGRVASYKAFGLRSVEHNARMEPNDLFRIYSMTKPITSTAMLILVDEGKVGLDDPVAKYLPEFGKMKVWSRDGPVEPHRPMTIRDLLQHTSGLTYGFFGETPVDSAYRNAGLGNPGLDMATLLDRLTHLPLIGHPGEVWNYGFSTDVTGRIIELVSGLSLDRFFSERIFKPLKMDDSFFEVPPGKRSRFTGYYAHPEGKWFLIDSPDTGNFTRRPPMFSGGGGLVSTAPDYLRFAQMVLNGGELDGVRVLKPETAKAMVTNHLPPALIPLRVGTIVIPGTGFGLGWSVVVEPEQGGPNDVGRAGWGGYANTYFWIDPGRRLIGMVLTQYFPFQGFPLDQDFRRLVYQALK
jgi:CubicO group peptidase (beta-lactamase class C family)